MEVFALGVWELVQGKKGGGLKKICHLKIFRFKHPP